MLMKNYFDLMALPQKLLINHDELKKQYHRLVKAHSHDPILQESQDDKPMLALAEKAYQTLKDRLSRIEHLLEVNGIKVSRKIPLQLTRLATEIEEILPLIKNGYPAEQERLKKLHAHILNEFSSISIELSHLEKAWDDHAEPERSQLILKKLSRKSAAFHYIRSIEQNVREMIH